MTTGEPLVVRGSMKPLPTLTKPLRSVDIATHAPGRGAARANRLLHGPRRRGGRRGDGGVRARRRLPAQVRRRPHRRRPRSRRAPTRSGSNGGRTSRRRRRRPPGGRDDRLHGGRQVDRRPAAAEALGTRGGRRRPGDRGAPGQADRSGSSPRTARRPSGPPRSGSPWSCSTSRHPACSRLAAARSARPRCARRCDGHLVVWIDVDPETAWARCQGTGRPLAADRAASSRLHATREPVYERLADVVVPHHSLGGDGGRAGVAGRASRRACGCCGRRAPRATTRPTSAPACWSRARFWPATVAGRRFLVTDGNAGRLYGQFAGAARRPGGDHARASSPRRSPTPRSCGRSWPAPG